MIKILLTMVAMFSIVVTQAQNSFKGIIKDSSTNRVLTDVSAIIKNTKIGNKSNQSGEITIDNVPNGKPSFKI